MERAPEGVYARGVLARCGNRGQSVCRSVFADTDGNCVAVLVVNKHRLAFALKQPNTRSNGSTDTTLHVSPVFTLGILVPNARALLTVHTCMQPRLPHWR